PDGFSLYYQHGAGLAGIAALVVGVWILRRLLSRHFDDAVTLVTLTAIVFGTNLFHYGVYDGTFSHVFSFMLVAALLDISDRWFSNDAAAPPLALGVVAALIVLTRHPNIVFLLIPLLWNPRRVWEQRRAVVLPLLIAAVLVVPQLLIYKQGTGHWFVSTY